MKYRPFTCVGPGLICSDEGLEGIMHIDDCKKARKEIDIRFPGPFIDLTSKPDPTRQKGCIWILGKDVSDIYWNPVEAGKRHRDYNEICWRKR